MGSCTCSHSRARVVEICTPASLAIAIRLGFVGSIHMSWLSPPGAVIGGPALPRPAPPARPPVAEVAPPRPAPPARAPSLTVAPPSIERLNDAHRKYVSSGLSGETAMRV